MIVYYWDAGMKRSDSYSSVTTSGKWLLGCPTDLKDYDLPLVIICKLENLLYITEEEEYAEP
mgnify:CR=1 FL=1